MQAGGIPFRVPAAGLVPFLALAVIAWLLTSIKRDEWMVVGGVIVVAVVIFYATAGARGARTAG